MVIMMRFKWVIVLAALQTRPPLPRLPHAARRGALLTRERLVYERALRTHAQTAQH